MHNGVSRARSIIKTFCDHYEEREPQVAVSVDMMDTGVDAPRVHERGIESGAQKSMTRQIFDPPFTDQHDRGLLGVFDEAAGQRIVRNLRGVNRNVG